LTRRANQRHSFIIAQSVRGPWARNGALFGVIFGETPYTRLKLHWLVKLQWLAAASDRRRVAERPRFRRAYRGHRWFGSGLPCDHGRTSSRAAPQNARLRTMALGTLIPNAFFVEAAPRRFVRCRHSAIHAETDTYDPRRPGATSSLLSCRQSQTLNRVSLAMLDFQIQKTPLTIRHERAQSERTNLTTELQRGCTASAERMPSRDRAAVIKTI
jgi:hypothetical protein